MYLLKQLGTYVLTFIVAGVLISFMLSITPDIRLENNDISVMDRFLANVKTFLTFDFGLDKNEIPIYESLINRGKVSLTLIGGTLIFLILIGTVVGVTTAIRPRSFIWSRVSGFLSTLSGVPVLIWVFGVLVFSFAVLGIVPDYNQDRTISNFITVSLIGVLCIVFGDNILADVIRSTHTTVSEELRKPYVRALEARGVAYGKHVFRGVVGSIYTMLVNKVAYLFTGAVVVEWIFRINGLGWQLLNSIIISGSRDYNFVLAATVVIILFIIVLRLIGDIIIALADPRIGRSAT